jgi:hypothetical protein
MLQFLALKLSNIDSRTEDKARNRQALTEGERLLPRNDGGTGCYHFATQLGSTGWNKVAQDRRQARRNPDKPALSDTGRHGLKR